MNILKNTAAFGVCLLVILSSVALGEPNEFFIQVKNPLSQNRACETISINLTSSDSLRQFSSSKKLAVYDEMRQKFILCQTIDNDGDGKNDELIFQADFKPMQSQVFSIKDGNNAPQFDLTNRTNAMFVPQRKDDFAWENDKIAFRMYGPELQRTELTSSGIDVWVKRVKHPVMENLYTKGDQYYHKDNSEGFDFYSVGQSLGCGGLGTWYDNKVLQSENFVSWKIISNGPLRSIFELTYKPWNLGAKTSGEKKRITLDLGSNFNKIQSTFDSDINDVILAVGIVKTANGGNAVFSDDKTTLTYWANPDPNNGTIGCAVILPKTAARNQSAVTDNQNILLAKLSDANSITYYTGACWSKSPDFNSEEKWLTYVKNKALLIENPLKIEVLTK